MADQSQDLPQVELPLAREVIRASARNPATKWPHPSNAAKRLTPFCVPDHTPKFQVGADATFFTIGSCFARNIETHLRKLGVTNYADAVLFPSTGPWATVPLNKYTPFGILAELEMAFADEDDDALAKYLIEVDGKYYDPHTLLMSYDPLDEVLDRRKTVRNLFRKVKDADVVIITLGQIECWYDSESGAYIDSSLPAPVVKAHPDRFHFKTPTFDECRDAMRRVIELLSKHAPNQRYLLTTSPVPPLRTYQEKDCLTAYFHAKCLLRTVAQDIADSHGNADYFPSFEMVMMSDRTVAFDEDLVHVRDTLVSRIVQKFLVGYLGQEDDGGANPRLALLQAGAARSGGDLEAAARHLETVHEALGDDPAYLSELAMVRMHQGDAEAARDALDRRDRVTGHAPDDLADIDKDISARAQYDLNRAQRFMEEYDFLSGAAQGLILLAKSQALLRMEYNHEALKALVDVLFEVKNQFVFDILDPVELKNALQDFYDEKTDISLRGTANEAVGYFNSGNHESARVALQSCATTHLAALAAPSSGDIRNVLLQMAEHLDLAPERRLIERLNFIADPNKAKSPLI